MVSIVTKESKKKNAIEVAWSSYLSSQESRWRLLILFMTYFIILFDEQIFA